MSKTDQAFIDAYRRRQTPTATSPESPMAPPASVAAGLRQATESSPHAVHRPHVRFGGPARAPLSEVMQARQSNVAGASPIDSSPERQPTPAATQLSRFMWPDTAVELVRESPAAFAGIVDGVRQAWPLLGLVGCRPGSGGTTTTLVLARLLAAQGVSVALIDADPAGSALAAGLGLKQHPTIASTLASGLPLPAATVHATEEGVSLLVAGPITQHPALVGQMLQELRQTHGVVLVDLGADPRRLTFQPEAVALVHPFDESDAVVEYSCRSLRQSGAALVGTIQTMVPAA